MIKVRFLIAFFFCGVSAYGQTIWAGDGPFGGDVRDVVSLSTGTLLSATGDGLFRSTDDGDSWTRVTSGFDQFDREIRDVEVDESGKIYAVTFANLYTSISDGVSWSKVTITTSFSDGRIIRVAPDGDIYLATFNGILRSSNGGATFSTTLYPVGNEITGLEVNSSESIFVSRYFQSILKGTSNGNVWSDAGSSGFPSIVAFQYRIALDKASPNNLYALTNVGPYKISTTGSAWSSVKNNLVETNFSGRIYFRQGSLFLFNNDVNKMFSSGDGGATWSSGTDYARPTEIISFAAKSASELFKVGNSFGVYKSMDGGVSWNETNNGIRSFNGRQIIVTPNEKRLLVPGNGRGYQISIDDGATWDLVAAGTVDRYIRGMLLMGDNSIIAYGDGIIRSDNESVTWSVRSTDWYDAPMAVLGNDLYTLQGTNLLISDDFGATWNQTAITGISGGYDKILVDATGNVYIREYDSRIYKIANGSSVATQLAPNAIDFTIADDVLMVLSSLTSLEKSTNGGTSFATVSWASSFRAVKIWAYSEQDIFTMGNDPGKFQISADGGTTWTSKNLLDEEAFVNDLVWVKKPLSTSNGFETYLYLATKGSVVHKSVNGVIVPPAPTNLVLKGTTYNQATIVWDYETDDFNTESFVIEESNGNNFSYTELDRFSFLGPNNQGKWDYPVFGDPGFPKYVRVKGINSAGDSEYTNELLINYPTQCASDIPDNRSWTAVATADAGFTAPGGAGPFSASNVAIKLRFGTINTFIIENYVFGIDNTNRSAIIDENCGVVYLAQNGFHLTNGGTWNPSTETLTLKWETTPFNDPPLQGTTVFTLNASDPIPDIPEIEVYNYSPTEAFINWNQVNFAQNFILERATTPGDYQEVATLPYDKVFYLDKNLVQGTTYYYRVKASNSSGTSATSVVKSITLQTVLFRPVENDISLNFENQQGVSWGDLDNDGFEDIASPSFTNSQTQPVPPVFYKNLGNGGFERKDIAVLINENTGVSRGINLVDFNNDGKLDVYITRSGNGIPDLLLINNGNWEFTKTIVPSTDNYSTAFRSSTAMDLDNDGYIDVFVGQDTNTTPAQLRDLLFRNNQNGGLAEITTGPVVNEISNSRDANTVDYNNDGLADLFTVNFDQPGGIRLYKNKGDGTFEKITNSVFATDDIFFARTTSWGDIDNDGDMDLFIGSSLNNPISPNILMRNNGDGTFTNLTSSPVAENTYRTFGSSFGDLDNDGDLDLFVSNGSIADSPNSIFFNDGNGNFTKYSGNEIVINPLLQSFGVAMADYDRDGFLDVYPAKGITSSVDLPNLLFRNTQVNSGTRNWIQLKLVGTQSNRSAIGARIKVTTNTPSRSQTREIASRTGYGSSNSLIAHFGLGSASVADVIEIKWPSGIVQTLNNVAINQVLTIVEDVTGPTFTFSPEANSTTAPIGSTISITLDEPATPVAGKFIRVRQGSESATPLQTINVTTGAVSGNTFTYTLNSSTEYQTQYFISVDDGAFRDQYQNPSLAVAPSDWSFTTVEPPDLTFPVITFNANDYVSLPKGFGTQQKLNAIASDNKAVTSFVMHYRKTTATQFSQVFGTATGASTYEFPLLESFFDDMGMEFYLEAKDAADNTTLEPATGYHKIKLEFDDTNTTLSIAAGSSVNSFQIRSVPFENLPSNQISVLFDELGQPDGTQYRVLKYQNSPEAWIEYPNGFNSVARGEGYFMIARNGANIKFGSAESPSNSQDNLFSIGLTAGWNLIGNPYTVTASWNESISGLTGVGALKVYQNGAYVDGNDMAIFSGGFVFADQAQQVPIKMKTSATGGRTKRFELSSDLDKPEWLVPLTLKQGDTEFLLGGIGMHPDAKYSYDDFDDLAPPVIEDKLEIAFSHPEHFMNKFSRDMVPTAEDQEWEFTVISSKAMETTIFWSPDLLGDNVKELVLYDPATQQMVDMRNNDHYVMDPKISSRLKIYFGENLSDKIKPEGISLGFPTPNPASNHSSIGFTISGSANLPVKVDVFDMMGRRVINLVDDVLAPGFYSVDWNVENEPSGMYTYRLSAGKQMETRKVIVSR
ncbi:MAG: VCBS repeat-containing protein [Cyclobacteriaceae bacterium]|nr:VCBS repeat-containing protein [Cyclobacteriaceae bacterium]